MQIEVHIQMIKYWLKLTLSHSHQYNKLFCKPSEWLSYVQKLLCQNGFAYVWQSNGTCIDHTVFMRSFEQRIKDNFRQKCFTEINISNRCILYKAIEGLEGHLYQDWIESVHYAMKLKTNIMAC